MAIVLSTQNVEPGVFAQFQPSTSLANPAGGLRLLTLVGTGITTATVNESVTRGSGNSDALHFSAVSLASSITDQNFVIYNSGVDYALQSGGVSWQSTAAIQTGTVTGTSFSPLSGTTLQVFVNGATQSVTFSGSDPISIASVLSQINAAMTGQVSATNVGNAIQLATVATTNTTLTIGTGSANSVLGFTAGLSTKSAFRPALGVKYNASYQRLKTAANGDFVPLTFFDIQSVVNWSGPIAVDNNNNILWSIPAAAALAFQNGASAVMVMEIDPTVTPTLVAFQQAIDKLKTIDTNIIVALNPDPNLQPYIKAHVDQMSSLIEQRFRTALVGLSGNPSISQVQTYAAALKDRRVALVYPPSATILIAGDNTPVTVDGTYIAAAIGGIRVNPAFDVAEPLLRKQPIGFNTISDTLLRTQKNVLANSGVMIVEYQSGVPRVRDGLTTDLTTADSAEYSVTEIIDFVSTTCSSFLSAAFIGTKLLNDTPHLMAASLNIILQSLVSNKVLNNFANVLVVRDPINPTQIDVSFQIAPVFPVKYILVTFTI